ncbi:MAG: beta-N-acetylhexosaminidase [Parvularculales bacterium]
MPEAFIAAKAFIAGCRGAQLTHTERDFFREANPWGFILFSRNCASPEQVYSLTQDLQDSVGRNAPVLIDQEGGRVARLKPPHWSLFPPAQIYGTLYEQDPERGMEAVYLGARLMAHELCTVGVNANCWPVLDVPVEGADPAIGDRAFGNNPDVVTALGRSAGAGLLEGSVLPVVKHIPGQGRALRDTHKSSACISASTDELLQTDWVPFRALNDLPMAMTGHVTYEAIDSDNPATLSSLIIDSVIRDQIGFDGLLLSDDISMRALSGDSAERSLMALKAGCDVVVHCNGDLQEMAAIAGVAPLLEGRAAHRAARALEQGTEVRDIESSALIRRFETLMEGVWAPSP